MALEVVFFDLGDTLVSAATRQWIAGGPELLRSLASRGFRLGILSNTGDLESRQAILALLPVDFDITLFEPNLVLFSSEIGLSKPAPEIFREATRRAGVPAGRCLYCSESLVETLAAERTGMIAVRVQPSPEGDLAVLEQVISDLNQQVSPLAGIGPMNRFETVVQILDDAVGGANAPVGFHGAFWRGVTRDVFVARKVLGLPLLTLGDGAGSNLVKALKGETPFGADIGNPAGDFNRMPSGRPPVSAADIAFIETWIDDRCPEDADPAPAPLSWRKTNAPTASSRTDDLWFIDRLVGWAVNSDGNVIHTKNGGESWVVQFTAPGLYLRCVGFADANVGWVGTLSPARRLLHTSDGGATWNPVTPLPASAPVAICGLSVVSDKIVYGSGTNRPADFPRMMKTVDGGATWTAWDMSTFASILIDCHFVDALHGWVVGGKSDEPTPTTRDRVKPVVLETVDGGLTWINRLAGQESEFPSGEWGWKIQFLDSQIGFVSLENFSAAAILKTVDGGRTWTRLPVNDPQGNVNLEGVGFIDEQRGWVGGWGPGGFGGGGSPQGSSSATVDGGSTWADANEIGLFINRFRFFGDPVDVGYASGDTVYKYSSTSAATPPASAASRDDPGRSLLPDTRIQGSPGGVAIRMDIPAGAKRVSLLVWTRFGEEVGCILDEIRPAPGSRVFRWDGTDSRGAAVGPGDFIVRLIVDDRCSSSLVKVV